MSARIISFPALETAQARRIIANPGGYNEAMVLDACEQLQRFGNNSEQQQARALQSAILRKAVAEMNQKAGFRRRLDLHRFRSGLFESIFVIKETFNVIKAQ